MKILLINNNLYDENCYIVVRMDDVTIIDPGFNYENIIKYMNELNLKPTRVLLTHGHIDHVGDLDKLKETYKDLLIYISNEDKNLLVDDSLNCSKLFGMPKKYQIDKNYIFVKDKDEINGFKFFKTPGHTKGSMVIEFNNDYLFTGDTLFKNSIGRTDLPTGDMKELNDSLLFITKSFSKSINILPGHYSKTTLKDEIKGNSYLKKRA